MPYTQGLRVLHTSNLLSPWIFRKSCLGGYTGCYRMFILGLFFGQKTFNFWNFYSMVATAMGRVSPGNTSYAINYRRTNHEGGWCQHIAKATCYMEKSSQACTNPKYSLGTDHQPRSIIISRAQSWLLQAPDAKLIQSWVGPKRVNFFPVYNEAAYLKY